MSILINYQDRIFQLNEELKKILLPYTQNNLLSVQDQANLKKDIEKLESLPNTSPKIMLFGMYNAGKSTLLNAIMGKELAEMGDYPVTKITNAYQWNGYTIVDTPGMDVTGEEVLITLNELTTSNVVIFVVQYGDIENRKLYEMIENVHKKGKRIIIAYNCKEGINDDKALEFREKIILNMKTQIGYKVDYIPFIISAKDALLGKQNNSQKLIDYSRIEPLEKELLKIIKEVDGFACFSNYLEEEKNLFEKYHSLIQEIQVDDKTLADNLRNFDKNYREFLNSLPALIKTESILLSKKLYNIAVENELDKDNLSQKLNDEINNFDLYLLGKIKDSIEQYLSDLNDQLGQMVEEYNSDESNVVKIDSLKVTNLSNVALRKSNLEVAESIDSNIPTTSSKVNNSAALGDSLTALSTLVPPTLVTPPIGPIPPIPVRLLVALAGQAIKIFGGGDDNDEIISEINAERDSQIRAAELKEQWRQELKESCEVICNDVEKEEVLRSKQWCNDSIQPIRDKLKEVLSNLKQEKKQIIIDNDSINKWLTNVNNLILELKNE